MATSTREPNAGKTGAGGLDNSPGNSEDTHVIRKDCNGYQIAIVTSLVNDRWKAWARIRVGREGQDTRTFNLITLGHKTEHEAQEAIYEKAKGKIGEVSNRNSQPDNAAWINLRDHPLMSHRGVPAWPPTWTQSDAAMRTEVKRLTGEIGILKHVLNHDAVPNKCFLVIEHEGKRWMGCLLIEDRMFCDQICDLLRTQLGRSIKEIGDLDLIFYSVVVDNNSAPS